MLWDPRGMKFDKAGIRVDGGGKVFHLAVQIIKALGVAIESLSL